jgi:Protein of unknown function (DUF2510)
MDTPKAAMGWYADSSTPSQLRYWDGDHWTAHTAPRPMTGPPQPVDAHLTTTTAQRTNGLSIAGIVCGVIAVFILPIVLGPAGIIMSAVALGRKEPLAGVALAVSVVGMLLGFVFGYMVATG